MRGFLATLSPADPARAFPQYPAPRDRHTLGAAITHVLVHSAQHAAEVAELLTQLGHSPGDLDFMEFLDETRAGPPPAPLVRPALRPVRQPLQPAPVVVAEGERPLLALPVLERHQRQRGPQVAISGGAVFA